MLVYDESKLLLAKLLPLKCREIAPASISLSEEAMKCRKIAPASLSEEPTNLANQSSLGPLKSKQARRDSYDSIVAESITCNKGF